MEVESPLPFELVFLSLALPSIWFAGRLLARRAARDPGIQAVIAPGIGVALWVVAIALAARAAGSFSIGLIAGTLGVALVALGGLARERAVNDAPFNGGYRGLPRAMWIGAAAATALIAPMALGWAFHDEMYITGHMSMVAQMQRDIFPPHHLTFPQFEFSYHYGFDLLAAVVTALTRLRPDQAIDAVTLASWGYTWCLLWVLGERWVGRSSGSLVAFVTLLGGGLPILGEPYYGTIVGSLLGATQVEGLWLNPPIVGYFFQHPWALGLPIALCALLVSGDRRSPGGVRYLVLGALMVMLSISQIVLFAALTGAIVAHEAFPSTRASAGGGLRAIFAVRFSIGRAAAIGATMALAVLVASRLGGFFGPVPDGAGSAIVFHPGVAETLGGSIEWLIFTYGLLLPLGAAGLFFLRGQRFVVLALLAGSLAVVLLFRHARSWDMVKFGTVTALSLSVLAAATIARIASLKPAAVFVPAAALALSGATAAGVIQPLVFALEPEGIPAMWEKDAPPLSKSDTLAVEWLRERVAPGEIVYRSLPASFGYAVWAGIPQPWLGLFDPAFGISGQRLAARAALLQELPPSVDAYLRQGVCWLVLDPNDQRLHSHANQWVSQERARDVAQFGRLRVVELLPPPQVQR